MRAMQRHKFLKEAAEAPEISCVADPPSIPHDSALNILEKDMGIVLRKRAERAGVPVRE